MKFLVRRTSVFNDDTSPCDGAVREVLTQTHTTAASRLTEFSDEAWARTWYETGFNHCEQKQGRGKTLMKDTQKEKWTIDIADLAALMEFSGEHGPIVLSEAIFNELDGEIEVYDGYRE